VQLAELRVLSRFVRGTKSATTLRPQLQALYVSMKTIKLLIISLLFVLLIQFAFVAATLEEGELKVPKIPVEEIVKWDSPKAQEYLANPENYDYHNGISKAFYAVASSPKYFLLNMLLGLVQVLGGVLICRFLRGSKNAI
jgi:hypothetical protein